MDKYIEKILTARVYDVAVETPLETAKSLSSRLNNRVLFKREDKQPVFSFKIRGAYNKIFNLLNTTPDLPGVICASAGNHAQGVALAAQHLGLDAIIVMPRTTPAIKVNAVRSYGGTAILHGDTYDEAFSHAKVLEESKGYAFIHAFDDPDTIAGQGTAAVELCRQHPDPLDVVFIPVGGGGLAAGMAVFLKYLRPNTKVIGVEPADAACMKVSLEAGERQVLSEVGIFADGVAVKEPGKETFRVCQAYLDGVITVTVDEICAAIKDIFDDTRTLMEPAGAVGVAGLKKYVQQHDVSQQSLATVTSGANVNFDRLRHVAERAEIGEQREVLLCVKLDEQPGAFRHFCKALGSQRSVTEFNYRYANADEAHVFAGVQISGGRQEREQILQSLAEQGYDVLDLTDNEMAKLHIRYMVGGRVPNLVDERLLRFEFPERPGALDNFLNQMAHEWNISLFHYRNHGSAYGRILVGIQVPKNDSERFEEFLQGLGYRYQHETENPAYQAFLN